MQNPSISRRRFLGGLAATWAALSLAPPFAYASRKEGSIPVLMFHKVCDHPRSPEELSPEQLELLFDLVWNQGFAPLNIGDMLLSRVDTVLPKGRKALGITVDDAHPSVIYGRKEHQQAATKRSFVEVFEDCAKRAGLAPRATLFLSGQSYFGGKHELAGVLDQLSPLPGLECGYHTRTHPKMTGWGYQQTRLLLKEQMEDFTKKGVFERIPRILAYPYGLPPAEEGLRALKELNFIGAVLAFPGVHEAKYVSLPVARYGSTGLLSPRFHIPRVNIGAYIYAPHGGTAPIDPREDFQKDAGTLPDIYQAGG